MHSVDCPALSRVRRCQRAPVGSMVGSVQDQSPTAGAQGGAGASEAAALERLRYPIGRFHEDPHPTPEKHERWITRIAALPGELRILVQDLSDRQLDTPYRAGGWTIRQVVHHVPDSHLNAYVRTKLALTEHVPTIKPYDEAAWAKLPDACAGSPEVSLRLLEGLHARWVATLRSLDEAALLRALYHPEDGTLTVSRFVQHYAWHGSHHHAHIATLLTRKGW